MKQLKLMLAITFMHAASLSFGYSGVTSYQSTISSLSIQNGDNTFSAPDPTAKPIAFIKVPVVPAACDMGFFQFPLMLTDLTDPTQKQMYATLVSARINGMTVTLTFIPENNGTRCRILGVEF